MLKYKTQTKCIVFDLDGTIYFGSELAEKANEVIQKSRSSFEKIFFVTNNSAKKREQIFEKLIKLGIDVQLEEVINSSYAIARYLKEKEYNDIYCIGTKDLIEEIASLGINVQSKNPKAVIVGYNINFQLSDLEEVIKIKNKDYKLIIGNKERVYPRDGGIITPGAGAIVAAVEYTLNKSADFVIGKPNPLMLEIITKDLNFNRNEVLVVGDSYESDIKMAKAFGANSILITNGKIFNYNCEKTEKLENLLELF